MAGRMRCVAPYRNEAAGLVYEVGQVFDASSTLRLFLKADAPGCFEDVVDEAPKAKRARAKTRQVKRPPENKGLGSE